MRLMISTMLRLISFFQWSFVCSAFVVAVHATEKVCELYGSYFICYPQTQVEQ